MAAITATKTSFVLVGGNSYVRYSGTGTADQTDTLSSGVPGKGYGQKVKYVTVAYSAAPTQAGVTIALDSGLGAAFDTTLFTGDANARYTFWQPDEEMPLHGDDRIIVTAPQAGGVITASIVIVLEEG